MTRSGRHAAAGRPPSRVLPVFGAGLLLALAAGGWSLFSKTPSEAEQLALTGEQSNLVLPPSLRTVTAAPARPVPGGDVRRSRAAAPGTRHRQAPETAESLPSHPMITPPEVPTVVVPTAKPSRSRPEVPELLPKTPTEDLGHLADSAAKGLTSGLRAIEAKVHELKVHELNWDAVARCASGNDPKAVTPDGAHGLYRFTPENWRSVGGTGLPSEATPHEQTKRAQLLYAREDGRWESLWPQCGRLLFQK
ncbi:transglycosylase family protein [Actinocorallia sp. B10E7]|uniref:transglycosylase family protein n=1 Tax=Actinocorallia sp. B10E7 TaxID=3153558 RepID=UPI00325EFD35